MFEYIIIQKEDTDCSSGIAELDDAQLSDGDVAVRETTPG
jgi:hypothetical protein